jgi:predicted signal transduction protein with EAL and GGDEF domain
MTDADSRCQSRDVRTKRHRDHDHHVRDLRELHHAGLARGLPRAGERNELHVEYQPIVTTHDGQLTGVEALLRWTHPSRGAVPPTVFIPFAEQSGQIVELGQWVLAQACSDREGWQRQRPDQLVMSVNVSSLELMSAGFVDRVAAVLDRTATDGAMLMLEVTERVLVKARRRDRRTTPDPDHARRRRLPRLLLRQTHARAIDTVIAHNPTSFPRAPSQHAIATSARARG